MVETPPTLSEEVYHRDEFRSSKCPIPVFVDHIEKLVELLLAHFRDQIDVVHKVAEVEASDFTLFVEVIEVKRFLVCTTAQPTHSLKDTIAAPSA
jgi:hypothetical protein